MSVRQGLRPAPRGSAQSQMAAAAARCVPLSSTRIATKDGPATTIKAWSATMAMMWAVPMASAGVRTTEVVGTLREGGEGRGAGGSDAGGVFGFRLGRVWGLAQG